MKLNNSCLAVKARALNLMNSIKFGQSEEEFYYTQVVLDKDGKEHVWYEYWSDGFWFISKKRKYEKIITNLGDHRYHIITHINNISSAYRRKIKVIKKRLDNFFESTSKVNCDECVFKNQYYLTKICHEHFRSKHLV